MAVSTGSVDEWPDVSAPVGHATRPFRNRFSSSDHVLTYEWTRWDSGGRVGEYTGFICNGNLPSATTWAPQADSFGLPFKLLPAACAWRFSLA